MDEESIGLFGVLLITTAVVLAHPFQGNASLPTLPQLHWEDMAAVTACGQDPGDNCVQAVQP